jgi:hypothetical protein
MLLHNHRVECVVFEVETFKNEIAAVFSGRRGGMVDWV